MENTRKPKTSSKQLSIATYKILLTHTKENPTSLQNIINTLELEYGLTTDRKAISDTVSQILELFPDEFAYSYSEKKDGSEYKKSYYSVSKFTNEELAYLNALQVNSKIITKELANSNKSIILPSHIYSKNNEIISNYTLIKGVAKKNAVLSKNYIEVEFNFCFYNYNKELETIKDTNNNPKKYVMIPMGILFQNGYLYMVSFAENGKNYNFRIDLVKNLKELDTLSVARNLPEIDNLDYNKNHLYMYSSEPIAVFLKLRNNNGNFTFVYDEFGGNFTVINTKTSIFKVYAPKQAIVLFIRKYIDRVEFMDKDSTTSQEILAELKETFYNYNS